MHKEDYSQSLGGFCASIGLHIHEEGKNKTKQNNKKTKQTNKKTRKTKTRVVCVLQITKKDFLTEIFTERVTQRYKKKKKKEVNPDQNMRGKCILEFLLSMLLWIEW